MSEADGPRRYAPSRDFPPYAFLPGQDPHPTRDPKGHSYTGESEPPAAYFEPVDWTENEDYLYGADLYNHGYLWEAHEAWEGLWHSAKHDELQAEHLQGLIQCAASALKVRMEQPAGVTRLAEIGTGRLERVAHESRGEFMGLDLDHFVERFRLFAASQPETPDDRPRLDLRS
ncbi:MAG: DUF309 domain-containing protein [Planctomycetota bacterium]